MAKVVSLAVGPREDRFNDDRQYDAIYILTDAGTIFRADINPATGAVEWKSIDLPPVVATQPVP
jgi:hypothetical protein